ncbi:MAG: hypothetical protein AAFQ51_10265, partial [Pseudomonadota bacterium]
MSVAREEIVEPVMQAAAAAAVPLVVDLDGSLSKSDTLHESMLAMVAKRPASALRLFGWLSLGKAGFKAKVADEAVIDAEVLPLNDAVVEAVRDARAAGRKTYLVSAADQRHVDAIAAAHDLFDEAIGSDGSNNLGGAAKADYLIERFGENG